MVDARRLGLPWSRTSERYCIDFRLVHVGDVAELQGAPRVDERCTGIMMRDYLRCTDLTRLPDSLVAIDEMRPQPANGMLIYQPRA